MQRGNYFVTINNIFRHFYEFLNLRKLHFFFCTEKNRFTMPVENRNSHCGCKNINSTIIENFSGFIHHLHLFLSKTVRFILTYLRNHIVEYLIRKMLNLHVSGLLSLKFTYSLISCTRNRLIGRDYHFLYSHIFMYLVKSQNHLNG